MSYVDNNGNGKYILLLLFHIISSFVCYLDYF